MTLSASWALQQAMHAALIADAPLGGFVSNRIYDRPPPDVIFPFVTLGDMEVIAADTGEGLGVDAGATHRLTLFVWSRKNGRRETKEIMSAVYEVLHNAALSLPGHTLVSLQFERGSIGFAGEAEAVRGQLRFRAYTETNP
ncbi:MAG: hypothetical protein COA62_11175 [Rhodobiaceae bacterium]|nr:MAG: hypothetical protein COA62_11175 [Rhodobiaceae bacterium]